MSTTRLCIGVCCLLAVAGCATQISPEASRVRVVTAEQKAQCQPLGVISTEQRLGPNKPGNAMNKALNAVAERGGNGIYVVSSNVDWAEGASVVAEALKCAR